LLLARFRSDLSCRDRGLALIGKASMALLYPGLSTYTMQIPAFLAENEQQHERNQHRARLGQEIQR